MNNSITSERIVPAEPPVTPIATTAARPARRTRSIAGSVTLAALVAVALTGGFSVSTFSRMRQEQKVTDAAAAAATAVPRVTVVVARAMASEAEQVLPGSARPLLEAGLYPRATGYIKSRLVDIGDRVQEGQLLAVIDSPDLDDQLAKARADLRQARASLDKAKADDAYAAADAERYAKMRSWQAASQDEYEAKVRVLGVTRAVVGEQQAAVKANEAAVQKYCHLQEFEKIVAPFPGVVTARHIDPGDLVAADSTARELFYVMRTDILRVFVDVPQTFATGIRVGQRAVVYRREDPVKTFSGKVTRTADALDASTRTLRTEVQVANPDNALRPGMYLQVKFILRREQTGVLVPSAAVVTRAGAPRVPVLDDQHRVQYRTVQVGRDYGAQIEVLAGLAAGDTVVVHPGDDVPEGTLVEPVEQQPAVR